MSEFKSRVIVQFFPLNMSAGQENFVVVFTEQPEQDFNETQRIIMDWKVWKLVRNVRKTRISTIRSFGKLLNG